MSRSALNLAVDLRDSWCMGGIYRRAKHDTDFTDITDYTDTEVGTSCIENEDMRYALPDHLRISEKPPEGRVSQF